MPFSGHDREAYINGLNADCINSSYDVWNEVRLIAVAIHGWVCPNTITSIVTSGLFLSEDPSEFEKRLNQNQNIYLPYFFTRAVMMLTAPDL
jgi:hypothetical protein